ncbi:MAG TPA: hemerythrin domain-containing protein [Myxococcota bacterium]|nr:hemerythrin domain-containing protein [Myxococcota bacterium]
MRRSAPLRDLSDEHHAALVLALRSRRAAASGEPGAVAAAWAEAERIHGVELEPHFAIEERWLVPPLEAAGESALAARLRADHAALRAALAIGALRSAEALAGFAERLAAHVRFEERELFPAAERTLPPAALAAIAEACRARRA